jgi:anti-anti-sigma factor
MSNWDSTRKDGLLTVQVEQAGDALLVWASGELTRSTAGRFEAELRKAIDNDASTVVLDLGAVGFIDSTGLRSVLRIANHSLRDGGRLRMRNASAPVQEAIAWGGLARKLPLVH